MLKNHLMPYAALFFFVQTIIRATLIVRAAFDLAFTPDEIINIFLRGMWFDIVVFCLLILPIGFYYLCVPVRRQEKMNSIRADRIIRFLFVYGLLFGAVSEHIFWLEFSTRFNFIAVDYLVYTHEVIGNIVESYPLHLILPAILAASLFLTWGSFKIFPYHKTVILRERAIPFFVILFFGISFLAMSDVKQARFNENDAAKDLAMSGIYSLFHAFRHNEIDYDRFYKVDPEKKVIANIQNLLKEDDVEFLQKDTGDLTRAIYNTGPEKHKNVVFVVMESMSAVFMETFGYDGNLTPELDKLGKESLFFTNAYATGTRTVRGLEALTLSIPPTPGQSIVRRPDNENLFSIGSLFKDRGYDTKFIYGGYGYFDNMSAFFSGNGFDVVDRTNLSEEEIQFSNIWGVCDEDLYERAIKEADASHDKKKPFMQLIMTTSNHRPYTYPEGRIDIPSHTGRVGGLKYADYSLGKYIKDVKEKSWFKDTVFVIVADHTAGAGGKSYFNRVKYHIPAMIYAPGMIKPRRFNKLISQIDITPTLLGLLNFDYKSKFFGTDVLKNTHKKPARSFISNYQKVALIWDEEMAVLKPQREEEGFTWPDLTLLEKPNAALVDKAVAYYQSASWWRKNQRVINTVLDKK